MRRFYFDIYGVKLLRYLCCEFACNTLLNAEQVLVVVVVVFDIFVVNLIFQCIHISSDH